MLERNKVLIFKCKKEDMKSIVLGIVLIVWMIMTLLLALSLIGIVVLIREDYNIKTFQGEEGESVWFRLGKGLVNKLIETSPAT